MKLKLLCLVGFLFGTIFVYGQSRQGFDSETFPPESWTIYHLLKETGNSNGWTRQLQSKTGLAGEENYVAASLNGSNMNDTDSWLITPKTLIKPQNQLNFMLKISGANGATTDTLDILLSETGKEKGDFTTRLLRITPKNRLQWSQYCIDLSAYAGKEIYIAFRDHLIGPESYTAGCKIYLDDVEISGDASSDLSVGSVISPRNDCSPIQYVELGINNTGNAIHEFIVCYQIDNGEIIKETINQTIESLTSKNVLLKTPAEFVVDSKSSFKAWVECEDDKNPLNDGVSSDILIGSQISFPYDMNKSIAAATDFTSFGFRSVWTCLDTGITAGKSWLFSGSSEGAALGSNCIDLPIGKIKISFKYLCSQHSIIKVANASIPGFGSYTHILGQSPLLLGNGQINEGSLVIDIPREGLQSLAFYVSSPNDENNLLPSPSLQGESMQLILADLLIESLFEDLSIDEINEPYGTAVAASGTGKDIQLQISNRGVTDQTAFRLCYQINDGNIVSEVYTKTLKSGESDHYLFNTKYKFDQEGACYIKAWLELADDVNSKNDSIGKELMVYPTAEIPYRMSFEKSENSSSWMFVNANQDAIGWQIADMKFKGDKVAYLSFINNNPNDDYLISPSIRLPEGMARLSFFYGLNNSGTMKLDVLMSKTNNPEDFKTILLTLSQSTDGWYSGYAPIEVSEAGDYYFAFHGSGINGEILLEEIRVDTEMDACIKFVGFEEKENYNLTESAVKIIFDNHSAKSIRQANVFYQLNNKEVVSEVINKEIKPGEQIEHTFMQQADLFAVGVHKLRGWVEIQGDIEEINNSMSVSHEHYKNKQIPYFQDFEDNSDRRRWNATVLDLNEDGNSWIPAGNASYSAYSGATCLYYDSNYAGDDWIFSECIEIPAGDFEFSFFYRTYKNFENRKENFKVMLGTSPHPDDMTIEMADFRQAFAADPMEHMKVIRRFQMENGGRYYIGIYTDSPLSQGIIVIDDIEIKKYEEKPAFYLSDFTNRFKEWTSYKLFPTTFDQWTKTTEEDKEYDIVQLKTQKTYTPGLFVSPGFEMKKELTINLEMEYALLTSNENDRFGLYMGNENHPDSLTTLIAELPPTMEWEIYDTQISVSKSGRYFFAVKALRAAEDKSTYYKLGYLKLTPAGLNTYELSGILKDVAGNVIPGAIVNLTGGQSQRTVSDKNGLFIFGNVLEQQTYTLEISEDKFIPYTQSIYLDGAAKDLGTIVLKYELLAPAHVTATLGEEQQAQVSWVIPGNPVEYRYDDGVHFGQIGFNTGTSSDVMGTVFRSSAFISELSWFTTAIPAVHEKVNVYILDLDKDGMPTNTVLYEATGIPNRDMEWNNYRLPEPVNAPNGFMVAMSYDNGSLGLAIDDGTDDYPFTPNTCYIGSLLTGNFSTFESQGGISNFLLRAKGIPADTKTKVSAGLKAAESSLSYLVYRFKTADQADETKWDLLTQSPVVSTLFSENVSNLDGTYKYAVKAVYPSQETSFATLSNALTVIKGAITGTSGTDGLHIWPVPAREFVTVNSDEIVKKYILYNMQGIVIANEEVNGRYFTIPVDKLAQGYYMVCIYTEKGKIERKLIKQ